MNLLYIYKCLEELEKALNADVSFSLFRSTSLRIKAFWFYKDRAIHWQYVVSLAELELIKDNSAFILYLIEKARGEYSIRISEIDNDRT